MIQEKMDRISALSRLARERELTDLEKEERLALRQEYIGDMKRSLQSTLESTYLVDDEGNETKLRQK